MFVCFAPKLCAGINRLEFFRSVPSLSLTATVGNVPARMNDADGTLLMNATTANAAAGRIGGPEQAPAELLDVRAVAELLNCSPRHIHRLSDGGRMPRPVKLGQLVRWRRAELMAWVNAGCPAAGTVEGATP